MKMVYVRFGKIDYPKLSKVYEGIVKGNEVQIIIPKPSHSGARDLLESIGFGDLDIFMVTGTPSTSTLADDGVYLENVKIVQKLEFDSRQEKIIIPAAPETPMSKLASKKTEHQRLKRHYEAGKDAAYHKIGGWQLFLNLFFCRWPRFLTPKSVR